MSDQNELTMRAIEKMQAEGKVKIIGETVIHHTAPDGAAEKAFSEAGMVFAFTDPSQSFRDGFEVGMIWQRIQQGETVIDCGFQEGFPVGTGNIAVINRMASCSGYSVETKDTGYEGWTSLRLSPAVAPRPRLRFVDGNNHSG